MFHLNVQNEPKCPFDTNETLTASFFNVKQKYSILGKFLGNFTCQEIEKELKALLLVRLEFPAESNSLRCQERKPTFRLHGFSHNCGEGAELHFHSSLPFYVGSWDIFGGENDGNACHAV